MGYPGTVCFCSRHLIDVDWQGNFKSFYEVVRIQIRCNDHTKILADRIFGIGTKLYKIGIVVEPPSENIQSEDTLEDASDKDEETERVNNGNGIQDSTRGAQTTKTTTPLSNNNTNTNGTSHHSRQTTLSYLQQL